MKNNPVIDNYAIAFIDLLGQQDLLRKIRELPSNDKENEIFLIRLKKTYGTVLAMQNSFTDFYDSYKKTHIDDGLLHGENKRIFREFQRSKQISFQNFSDCVVTYSTLSDDVEKFPIRSIFCMFGALASTFLTCLAGGHPIRGGMDIGLAMEVNKNQIYGPALSRAYTLESKCANYPRIVIGDELVKYLKSHLKLPPHDMYSKIKIKMAELCLSALTEDYDGLVILDYLGPYFTDNLPPEEYGRVVESAYKKINESFKRYQSVKNTKIATKYLLLKHYFESSRPDLIQKNNGKSA